MRCELCESWRPETARHPRRCDGCLTGSYRTWWKERFTPQQLALLQRSLIVSDRDGSRYAQHRRRKAA